MKAISTKPKLIELMSKGSSLLRKFQKARDTLKSTIFRILDINKKRKQIPSQEDRQEQEAKLNEELRVLNEIVHQQAGLMRKYEADLELEKA